MESAVLYDRLQFAFTATFHDLFPQLTMGRNWRRSLVPMRQSHESKNPPLPSVIGLHHHPEILNRDYQEEGPNQEGQNAKDRGRRGSQPNGRTETSPQRIEGTRADIALHNLQSGKCKQAPLLVAKRFRHRDAYTGPMKSTQPRRMQPAHKTGDS